MRKIKMFIYIVIVLFIMLPSFIYAATELGASTQSPVVGTDFYVQLDLNYKDSKQDLKIRDVHLFIKYDPSYLEFGEIVWIQSKGTSSHESGVITIDKEEGKDWNSGATLQIKFKMLKDGLTKIDVERNGESHYNNGNTIGQSFAGVSINGTKPSSQTLIGSLTIDGYTLQPTFSKTTYQYNLIVPSEETSVYIQATKSDNRQTITGLGRKKLSYGDNVFPIVVTAEDGSSRTYSITVHRTDNRNGDTSLVSLNVTDTNIKYESGKKEYEATVSRSVDSVLITARPNDSNATVIGTGRKKLNIGLNTFSLIVSSSGGKESQYTININRSTEEIEQVSKSSKLKSLKVNSLVLDLANEKKIWQYGIGKDTTELAIETQTESETAKVEIIGNENLKSGLNVITIKVIEPAEKKQPAENEDEELLEDDEEVEDDITEYYLVVYKNPSNTTIINDITGYSFDTDIVYTTIENDSHIIPVETIKTLKDENKKLYYNVVNMYNGIIYQAIISKNLPDTDLDASFKKISENQLTYETSLPKETEMLLYVGDYYFDNVAVKIYTYDEPGQYTLLTDGILVQNGYISFNTNGQKNYIITTNTLIEEQSIIEKLFSKYKIYFLGGLAILAVILLLISFINKKRKQKINNEPLY